jgi:cobalt-zinc-cadmium efflux system protein
MASAHHHPHNHLPKRFGAGFAISAVLNLGLVVAQAVYGVLSHSTALLADAAHNLGDTLGLLLAWGAYALAFWRPTERYTYGFRSSSILAAFLNAVILLVATGAIAWEAVQRFSAPQPVAGLAVMIVAAIAIVINGLTAWIMSKGERADLNIRSAYLHMLADALVSLGVVIAGLLILLTGWMWIDPLASLIIAAVIIWGTWGLLRSSLDMSLQAVPRGIEPAEVRAFLSALPGVEEVHDLHIWPMSTTETALTCHLVMPEGSPRGEFLTEVCAELFDRFHIQHPTIQVEPDGEACKLAPDHVV